MADSWMLLSFHPSQTSVHVCNKGKHRNYRPGRKRLTWLINWIRGASAETSKEMSPWYDKGYLELEVYL